MSDTLIASAPAVPGTRMSIAAPEHTRMSTAVMMPRGMSRLGSADSSAASGTPSTARKNQIPKTSAARMPALPKGRNSLAPAASVGAMSNRLADWKCGTIATTKVISAMSATAVITNISFSASPTPKMWMPMNSA